MSRPIYCTAAAACDLPRAQHLGRSLSRHLGDVDFRVLLLEHPRLAGSLRGPLAPFSLLTLDEVAGADWVRLAFTHGGAELGETPLACALRELYEEFGLRLAPARLPGQFGEQLLRRQIVNGDRRCGRRRVKGK